MMSEIDGIPCRIYQNEEALRVEPFELEEIQVIGADQGADTYILNRFRTMVVGLNNNLYVYDYGDDVMHIFGAAGNHIGQFGQAGEGPGDFGSVGSLFFQDGKLAAYDSRNRRISFFTPEGVFDNILTSGDFTQILIMYPFSGAEVSGYIGYIRSVGASFDPEPVELNTCKVQRFNLDGELIDSPVDTVNVLPQLTGNRYVFQYFYRWTIPLVAISRSGMIAWSFGEDYTIKFYDPVNENHYAVQIPSQRIPVTTEIKEWILEDYYREGAVREDARHALVFPEYLPVIGSLFWDELNRIWVGDYYIYGHMEPNNIYQVFDSDGHWLFQQTLPASPAIITADDCYIQSELDDGTPVIRRYKFVLIKQ